MSKTDLHPEALRRVRGRRISTAADGKPPIEEEICVAREGAVVIDVENVGSYTVLCAPADRYELVAGFLFSEGIIDGMADVETMRQCDDDPGIIRVKLTESAAKPGEKQDNRIVLSSCGACGTDDFDTKIRALPKVGDTFKIENRHLPAVRDALREHQVLFESCGGTHAAGIFDDAGKILACAEDTGRHNALDKAIGKCLLLGIPTAGRGVALSGRVSLEMIGKCARAGLEVVTAISAPTSLAIDVAERCNITLCAFVRETRATVLTHPRRVTTP
jgi:FdhD protein